MRANLLSLAFATALIGSVVASSAAAQSTVAPVYARQRAAVMTASMRDPNYRPPPRPPFGHGGFGHGGFGFWPYQPTIAGSWYERPYPYHFDYYRWRYSAPQAAPGCVCADEAVGY